MSQKFKDSNQKTVEAYDLHWGQHQIKDLDVPGEYFEQLDWFVFGVDKSVRIFEIGSGVGYDAVYFRDRGYQVDCSEAAPSAVKVLRRRGLPARKLNALTDKLPGGYQLILALGVVVHFNRDELQLFFDKVFAALEAGGRFGFSTVEDQAEEWYQDGHGRTRYISHLPEADLRTMLKKAGFGHLKFRREKINDKVDGLLIIAS